MIDLGLADEDSPEATYIQSLMDLERSYGAETLGNHKNKVVFREYHQKHNITV